MTIKQQMEEMNEQQLLALSDEVLRGRHDIALAREGLTWLDAHKLIEEALQEQGISDKA